MSGENPSADFNRDRAELFEALGHPTRIKILELLSGSPQGFSDLKKRLDIESSGLLQFHLGKLHGLVRIEEGNYALTDDGREALRVIQIGTPEIAEASLERSPRPERQANKWVKIFMIASALILVSAFAAPYVVDSLYPEYFEIVVDVQPWQGQVLVTHSLSFLSHRAIEHYSVKVDGAEIDSGGGGLTYMPWMHAVMGFKPGLDVKSNYNVSISLEFRDGGTAAGWKIIGYGGYETIRVYC